MNQVKIDVILPAAGVGKRMQLNIPKQYAKVNDLTVLEHTIRALKKSPFVNNIIVAVSAEDEYFDSLDVSIESGIIKSFGGKERSDTVRISLDKVTTPYVMVHDAARPLIDPIDIQKLSQLCIDGKVGGILCAKVSDTIKLVKDGKVVNTVDRSCLYRAYTPQLFKTDLLKSAIEKAYKDNIAITDDASAMEYAGFDVEVVEGRADNFKLTTKEDLYLFEKIIKDK